MRSASKVITNDSQALDWRIGKLSGSATMPLMWYLNEKFLFLDSHRISVAGHILPNRQDVSVAIFL